MTISTGPGNLTLLLNQIKKYDCFFTFPLINPLIFFLNPLAGSHGGPGFKCPGKRRMG
jgi:hypothetical protein